MKRILLLLSVFIAFCSKSQSVLNWNEGFGTGFDITQISNFDPTSDWILDDGSSAPNPPICNVVGTSGASMLFGADASTNTETVGTIAINTLNYTNLQLSWNYLRFNVASGPVVVCEWATNTAGPWTPVVYTPGSAVSNTWGAVAPVTLPAGASSTNLFIRWTYNSTGNNDYIAIDDVKLTGTGTPVFYWDGTNLTNTGAWWDNTAFTGTVHPVDFVSAGQTFNIWQPIANLAGTWTVSGAGTFINIGDGTVPNQSHFTIPTGATLSLQSGAKINVTDNSTLSISSASIPALSSVSLSTVFSTIEFAQAAGTATIWSTTYANLFLTGAAIKVQPANHVIVLGQFNVASGTSYSMTTSSTRRTELSGQITCNGSIIPNTSHLTINGSGAVGTLIFSATTPINNFTFIRAGQTLTLGSDLNVNGITAFTSGIINLNGKSLKFSGNVTLPTNSGLGVFIGSTSSSLTFTNAGSGSVTNNLNMDQTSATTRSLKVLNTQKSLGLGNALEITDSVKISGGTLTASGLLRLKSTAPLKARIAEITGGGAISGNIIVETFAAGGTTDWTVMGVSGVQSKTMNDWYDDFPMAIEGSATGVTSAGGYFESVQGWKENDAYGYDTSITIGTALTPGKGFWVYLGTGLTTTGDITMDVTGLAVTGNPNIAVSSGGPQNGFNLVSNPFASPISWAKVLALSPSINNAIYIYNPDAGQTQYASFASSHPSTQGANDVIPMGQGFYIQSGGGGSLNFSEACKVSNNTSANPLLRSSEAQSVDPIVGTVIHLKIEGGGASDYCALRLHQNATTSFDGQYDAYKIYDSPGYVGYPGPWTKRTVIGTQLNNVDYGINSVPYPITQNLVLPVVVRVYGSGSYTISGTDLQNIPGNSCITLKDKLLNVNHDLRTSDYVCNIIDTTYAARFELIVCPNGIINSVNTVVSQSSNSIFINKDAQGIFVDFDFKNTTKANITVTNILGQKIMDTKKVKVTNDNVYLDLNVDDQLIFVTVETENEKVTKKFLNFR